MHFSKLVLPILGALVLVVAQENDSENGSSVAIQPTTTVPVATTPVTSAVVSTSTGSAGEEDDENANSNTNRWFTLTETSKNFGHAL
ncbi:hypothetical protein LTR60_003996, partial [Cryomyces antarcticus]